MTELYSVQKGLVMFDESPDPCLEQRNALQATAAQIAALLVQLDLLADELQIRQQALEACEAENGPLVPFMSSDVDMEVTQSICQRAFGLMDFMKTTCERGRKLLTHILKGE